MRSAASRAADLRASSRCTTARSPTTSRAASSTAPPQKRGLHAVEAALGDARGGVGATSDLDRDARLNRARFASRAHLVVHAAARAREQFDSREKPLLPRVPRSLVDTLREEEAMPGAPPRGGPIRGGARVLGAPPRARRQPAACRPSAWRIRSRRPRRPPRLRRRRRSPQGRSARARFGRIRSRSATPPSRRRRCRRSTTSAAACSRCSAARPTTTTTASATTTTTTTRRRSSRRAEHGDVALLPQGPVQGRTRRRRAGAVGVAAGAPRSAQQHVGDARARHRVRRRR